MNNKQPVYSQRYRAYILLILTGVYTFNFIDRQILVIIQESIKAELGLSDTQLGLLTGFTFAVFYVTLGLPIARFADKNNRRNVVGWSLAIWSGMTAVSGLVANFFQLLLARVGVGVGEAGGSPPAHSMISDYFPVHQRATALAIYSMGIYIGILAGYSIGGWIDATYGWRMAFFALGIPGIVYALVLFFTVKEPPKGHSDNAHQSTEKGEIESSFWEVVQLLLSKKTFVFVALACGFHTFGNYGVGNFYAPFLARVHGMPIEEIGIWLGVTTGFGGITGTFLGGYLVDKFGKKDLRWYLWIPVIAGLLNYLVSYYTFFGENLSSVLFCYAIVSLLTAMYLAPAIAITHNLVDAKKRALASAILFLVLNFIGLGLGPLGIGLMSDYLTPEFGAESLRYAFTMTWGTGFLAILCFYFAGKTYRQEAITKVTVTEVKTEISDMQPILQIVGGAFLLFVVGLFFLQIGLAGVGVTTLASWIFVVIGLLFFSGVYLLFKGIVNGK